MSGSRDHLHVVDAVIAQHQRALVWLSRAGITNVSTHGMAEDALRSAAYTYVVAALGSLATLLYYIMIFLGGRSRD